MCKRVQILYEVLHKFLSLCVRDDTLYVNMKIEGSMCDVVNRGMKRFIMNSTVSD